MTSTTRKSSGGWVSPATLPKGENGRPLCRRCGAEVPKGRKTFCSKGCVDEHCIRTDTGYLRRKVLERDRGVCAVCAVDTVRLKQEFREIARRSWGESMAFAKKWGATGRANWWDADHIVPVIEGGGECGLDNIRTLCIPCHKKATAELRARMAQGRKQ